jgi:hypothetical protein
MVVATKLQELDLVIMSIVLKHDGPMKLHHSTLKKHKGDSCPRDFVTYDRSWFAWRKIIYLP